MVTEAVLAHCAVCFSVAGERVPLHDGAHLFEGHPSKNGAWYEHWELRLRGLAQFGDEFDASALKMFGYRPRDRWGLEPRKGPNYGAGESPEMGGGKGGGRKSAATSGVSAASPAATAFSCGQCGHGWTPRRAGVPVKCPKCDSRRWAAEASREAK